MSTSTDSRGQQVPVAGARFYKCALQVNPAGYAANYRGQSSGTGEEDDLEHAQAIIDKAVELGIEVLAVTDHNSVASLPCFRSAAHGHQIRIFPGFELASSEGVHVLCIYSPESSLDRLERCLGEFGIRESKPSPELSYLSDKALIDLLELVHKQGGVAIAAHCTNDGGLFKVLQGQARIRAWKSEYLLAIQIPGSIDDLPQDIRQIVENRNGDYRRDQAPEARLAVAVLNAKDVVEPSDLEHASSHCLIKMNEASVDGLRQAFLDPGSRVRVNDSEPQQHMEITSLKWEGGFLDGVELQLNPNLNALIGGRGTGKSTIVESIRSVLGLTPLGEESLKVHKGFLRHVLCNGTKISLRVRVHRPSRCEYLIEQILPNPPLVRNNAGDFLHVAPSDVLPKVEVYGQHEISELARIPEQRTRLLDRFIELDEDRAGQSQSLSTSLAKNRRSICDLRNEIRSAEDRLSSLPGLQETLKRFQKAGLEERLKEQSQLLREEQLFDSLSERIAPFKEAFASLEEETPLDLAFISDQALSDLPGREIIADLNAVLDDLNKELEQVVKRLGEALSRAESGAEQVRKRWAVRKQEVQASYEKILRQLQKSRVDGEDFMRLRRQIESLRPIQERLGSLKKLEEARFEERRKLLAEWEDTKASEYRHYASASTRVSRRLKDRVQVTVTQDGNREPLFEILRSEIGGRMSEAIESLGAVPNLSLPELVSACRSGAEKLREIYHITPSQADRLAKAEDEVLMQIEELQFSSTTEIRLNTSVSGEEAVWRRLEDLSTGQKATAILLLLLLESGASLVIDQPEDDLDNRFITDGIVPRIREAKQSRQFIFSTHNANLPVLGDAELIIGLSAIGEAATGAARVLPECMGSIDSPQVREIVEEILEGGREAFETRRRKYGF